MDYYLSYDVLEIVDGELADIEKEFLDIRIKSETSHMDDMYYLIVYLYFKDETGDERYYKIHKRLGEWGASEQETFRNLNRIIDGLKEEIRDCIKNLNIE